MCVGRGIPEEEVLSPAASVNSLSLPHPKTKFPVTVLTFSNRDHKNGPLTHLQSVDFVAQVSGEREGRVPRGEVLSPAA